ncbi:MAG: tRNA pseudouridine(38-40) synthase TruA [Acidobacteriota bacterium]
MIAIMAGMGKGTRIGLRIAYLGAGFAGWQRQPGPRSVQGDLEQALERIFGRRVPIVGAGRTDAGVHADAQVAHFDAPLAIPPAGLAKALNASLDADVRVLRAWHVSAAFDARRSARGKRYRYRLAAVGRPLRPWEAMRTWQVTHRLDVEALSVAADLLPGAHDFASFALAGHAGTGRRGTVRTISSARVSVRGRRIDVVLEGDGFLRGMVRRIVGALVEVGRGARDPEWLASLLQDPTAGPPAPTAPALGLTLEKVFYR